MTRISFGPLFHQTLGFENFIRDVEKLLDTEVKPTTFPPHNIIKVDDNRYIVELAVAGFSKDEIEITRQDGVLKIVSNIFSGKQSRKCRLGGIRCGRGRNERSGRHTQIVHEI